MAVFYIRERNAFYSWLTLNHITPTAQALWNALFTIYNAQGWPDEWLEVPESLLCSYMHVGKQALYDARNQLKNKGLLDFKSGNRNKQAVKYRPIWLTPQDEDTTEAEENPQLRPSYPQGYLQPTDKPTENPENAASWSENHTNKQTNTDTKNHTNKQTNTDTKEQTNKQTLILNNKPWEKGIPEEAFTQLPYFHSLTPAPARGASEKTTTAGYSAIPLELRHYLPWWVEFDTKERWLSPFADWLARHGKEYTRQMLNCALTITQNKFDRERLTNPLEYMKATLMDWKSKGMTSRLEIEQYLECTPLTGGYFAAQAYDNDHEYQYG